MLKPRHTSILFAVLIALCTVEVGWWLWFQFREAARLENAGHWLTRGDVEAAARALGADDVLSLGETARGRRMMFAAEGTVLGLAVLAGVVVFYTALRREQRIRRTQERFLAGATHELQTPLTTLRLGLESLAAGRMPEEKRERYLRNMLAETDRLGQELGNLLTVAGLAHDNRLYLRSGDLADDLHAVRAELGTRAEAAGVAITVDADTCVTARDEHALRIVLRNLIDNAIKYSAQGTGVSVTLSKRPASAEISIRDRGRGIPADDLPHVFERFYRGSTLDHAGGTGLGLYLVKELVEQHGGKVSARSDGLDSGSEFVVSLPLREERTS